MTEEVAEQRKQPRDNIDSQARQSAVRGRVDTAHLRNSLPPSRIPRTSGEEKGGGRGTGGVPA